MQFTVERARIGIAVVVTLVWEFAMNVGTQKGYFDAWPNWVLFLAFTVPMVGGVAWILSHPKLRQRYQLVKERKIMSCLLFTGGGAAMGFALWLCFLFTHPASESVAELRKTLVKTDSNAGSDQFEDPSPGLVGSSFALVASFRKTATSGRKYIFESDRYALFFDSKNALRFLARDSAGEEHSVKVDTGPDTLFFNSFVVLVCEAGSGGGKSLIRLLINGRLKAKLDLDHDVGFSSEPKPAPFVLGADLKGRRGGKFLCDHYACFPNLLTKDALRTLVAGIAPEGKEQWMEFDGDRWLSRDDSGNLSQPVNEHQPRLHFPR